MMRWLFRPWLFLTLSAAAVVGALALTWVWGVFEVRTGPLAVANGDREIVWLYPATNSAAWERFVAALRRTPRPGSGLEAHIGPQTFPRNTTDVPEASLSLPGRSGRLVFRWYKLTSERKARDWISDLLARTPPPLAIIGGSSSDTARELAILLGELTTSVHVDQRPLLLLTTATADLVPPARKEGDSEPPQGSRTSLGELYPGRTFRFSFSNRQMAAAVTHFIWSQDDLRPDRSPAHMVRWADDSYSNDLIVGFSDALESVVTESACRQWGWATGAAAGLGPPGLGCGPFPWDCAGSNGCGFRWPSEAPQSVIDSSVGSFALPNQCESQRARELVERLRLPKVGDPPPPQRPLLVLTGQTQPCRRFLRAVMRCSPDLASHCVVATGDALAFNTVYRDRVEAWHIQDLPYPLIFFCHHNPTDRDAGFRPDGEGEPVAATGTEDVLLYQDILEATAWAAAAEDVAGVQERLHQVSLGPDGHVSRDGIGAPLFGPRGGRRRGTGEHVVCLRPLLVLGQPAKATIEVWALRTTPSLDGDGGAGPGWRRLAARFKITDKSLTSLQAAGVPAAVLAKLSPPDDAPPGPTTLKDKSFATREDFSKALQERLEKDEIARFAALVLDHASQPLEVRYEEEMILGGPAHGD